MRVLTLTWENLMETVSSCGIPPARRCYCQPPGINETLTDASARFPHWSSKSVMNPRSPEIAAHGAPETITGLMISLLFWLSLVAATVLFAAVALSPKLIERLRLQDQYHVHQFQLVQIEQQNEQLERVLLAIRQDKDFAEEMTRIEFDAVRRDEEIIPVESGLRLSPRDLSVPHSPAVGVRAWYRPLLVPFAENDSLRGRMLGAAAALVVVSFTWFQPAAARQLARPVGACRFVWNAVRSRYIRPS